MLTTIAILTFQIGFCIYEFFLPPLSGISLNPWGVELGHDIVLAIACLFFIASFVLTIIDLAYRIYCWKHYV